MKYPKLKVLLAVACMAVFSNMGLAQTPVDLVNGDFSLGGNGGGGFDNPTFDTPGWMNAGPNQSDSGNDSNIAWVMNGNDGAYQLSTYLIQSGETFTLTWQAHDSWNSSVQKVSLISGDATNTPYASTVELATVTNTLTTAATWPTYVLNYTAGPGDVGKHIGVYFNNVKVGASSWANWDNFAMTVAVAGTPPSVVTPPDSQTLYEGSSVAFSVAASGSLPLSYQWKAGAIGSGVYTNLTNGGRIAGATNATLTISDVRLADSLDYVVVVTNSAGSATGGPATLTVNAATYVNGLFNGDFELPGTVKITQGFDLAGASDVPGWKNTGSTYLDSGVQAQPNTGAWCAYLQGSEGGAYQISTNILRQGDNVSLVWWARDSWNGSMQKVSLLAAADRAASYAATTELTAVTNSLPTGYTQYTLSYTATAGDAGKYVGVFFINANPSAGNWADFDDFSLLIISAGSPPTIIASPASQTAFLGATVHFSVSALGNNLSYQWKSGAVGSGVYTNLANGGQFSGVTTTNLTITNLQNDNAADYIVVVSNAAGSVSNNPPATLTIDPSAPTITSISPSTMKLVGDTAMLTVTATGAVSYQWKAGAVGSGVYTNLPNSGQFSGANAATLVITNIQKANQLDYVVEVSNGGGPSLSSVVNLTVLNRIYAEYFDVTNTTSLTSVGWVADTSSGNDRIFDPSAYWPSIGGVWAYNGSAGVEAFYTSSALDPGAFVAFNVSQVSNVVLLVDTHSQWAPAQTHSYFAVQMNGANWYVSNTELPQPTTTLTTQSMPFSTNAAAWNELTVSGTGSTTLATIGSGASADLSGTMTGAGFVVSHDGSSTVNFDNFKIAGDGFLGPINLRIATSGSGVQLAWSYGTLLEATNLSGPWTTNSTATSPYVAPTTGAQKFFRIQYP